MKRLLDQIVPLRDVLAAALTIAGPASVHFSSSSGERRKLQTQSDQGTGSMTAVITEDGVERLPHGRCATHADTIGAEPLSFMTAWRLRFTSVPLDQ